MTDPAQRRSARLPRPLGMVRIALLVVLVAALVASAVTDGAEWLTIPMVGCAIALAGFRLWDLWAGPEARSDRPSPVARLWRRTEAKQQRDHTGDWW